MKIKISASFSGVISRGSYENSRPGFAADLEFDAVEGADALKMIRERQKMLQEICYQNFKACEDQAVIERINKERQDIRWYPDPDGYKMPSVTSVIGFDADMYCSPEELAQYAAQSNLCHKQVEHFISSGEWKEAKDIPACWPDLVIIKKGALQLETEGWSFPDFLKKYHIKEIKNALSSFNEVLRYGGTPDFIGIPQFEGAEPVLTIFDVKRTVDKVKNFKQMAAYSKMKGYEEVKQICIVPLNNKTQQGFSKPQVETKIDGYFSLFKEDRENFKRRFGV